MKFAYVLLDGCADRPSPLLNYTTPLQAAATPNMDRLASSARLGRVITVGRGIAPESDIAVFSMLGYSFRADYPGRGVVEAVGAGLKFRDGDLALRANLATAEGRRIVDRRAGRDLSAEEGKSLEEEINGIRLKNATFHFKTTVSYRGVLVIRSDAPLAASVTNTDPAYSRHQGFGTAMPTKAVETIQECKAEADDPAARRAAVLVNEFTSKALKALAESPTNAERARQGRMPASCVLLRDAGDHLPHINSFKDRYGLSGTALVEMPAEVGIAKLLGMKMVVLKERNDLSGKAKAFERAMAENSLVYVHIKGPDEFGHDGDANGKRKCIESIDRDFFGAVYSTLAGAKVGVSCDHATPCTLKMHSSDPVPLMVTSDNGSDGLRFTEWNSKKGSIGTLRGVKVLPLLTNRSRHRARS